MSFSFPFFFAASRLSSQPFQIRRVATRVRIKVERKASCCFSTARQHRLRLNSMKAKLIIPGLWKWVTLATQIIKMNYAERNNFNISFSCHGWRLEISLFKAFTRDELRRARMKLKFGNELEGDEPKKVKCNSREKRKREASECKHSTRVFLSSHSTPWWMSKCWRKDWQSWPDMRPHRGDDMLRLWIELSEDSPQALEVLVSPSRTQFKVNSFGLTFLPKDSPPQSRIQIAPSGESSTMRGNMTHLCSIAEQSFIH